MNILLISNDNKNINKFHLGFKREGVNVHFMSFNNILSSQLSQEYDFTAVVHMIETTVEIKQFLLINHKKLLTIPSILVWTASQTIPKALQDVCDHSLTLNEKPDEFIRKVKELAYSHTVNDFYNSGESVIELNGLILDRRYRELIIGDRRIKLRNKEYGLIEFFMLHPNKLLCRNTILESVWDINKTFMTNTVDVHIGKLRKILGPHKHLIKTVHSIGYIFG